MATLFRSLVSATDAVELAVTRDADPRTHVLTSHRHMPEALVLHADRCCNHGGEELGFYTATQARNLLATDEPMIVPCTCMLASAPVFLAA
jgi:hypothetical protein